MTGARNEGRWCILRCSGAKTLELAASLNEAGFEAWAPVEVRERLAGRKRDTIEQVVPILPEYVFVPFHLLNELIALQRSPSLTYQVWDSALRHMVTKGRPYFRFLLSQGEIRPVRAAGLQALRTLEADLAEATERRREANKQKGPPPQFKEGDIVRVVGAGFDGLDLTVAETNQGRLVKLKHPSWMWTVEISAWILEQVQLKGEPSEQTAAKAA
jgi:transcription antitermination factor NusG